MEKFIKKFHVLKQHRYVTKKKKRTKNLNLLSTFNVSKKYKIQNTI